MPRSRLCILGLLQMLLLTGCATVERREMTVSAYCGCAKCCGWQTGGIGSAPGRVVANGPRAGQPYTGRTSCGARPRQVRHGLFSLDSLDRPWMIPVRLVCFPWLLLGRDGTLSADTSCYPFGTRIYVPGYGWGVVADRGSAILGAERIEVYFDSHDTALAWGRRRLIVSIRR